MSRDVFRPTVDPEAMSGSNPHTVKNLRESNMQETVAVLGEIVRGGYRRALLELSRVRPEAGPGTSSELSPVKT